MKTLSIALSTLAVLAATSSTAASKAAAEAAPFRDEPNTVIASPRQITFQGPRSGEGYFSADGRKMIFQSERHDGNPFYQMYVLDLATGATKRLSPGPGKTTCGWIHPSGRKAMWSSTHLDPKFKKKVQEELDQRKDPVKGKYAWSYDETFDIFESDLDGKKIKRLTKELGYDAEGSYSPDGKWIAFASNRAGYAKKLSPEDQAIFDKDPSFMMDIYLMKSDGTGVKRLTDAKGYDGGPFFSADGRKITWRRFAPNGMTAEVYTMNVDGTDQKPVTRLGAMSWAPFYHPSGDYLIFATSALGFANFELFIVDAEGTKPPVRVTFDDGFDGLATFTPDGNQVSWTHRNEKGESQIYLASWDDAQARRLLGLAPRDPGPLGLDPAIRADDAKRLVAWMASERMAGRQAGSPQEKILTAKYAELFKSWGLVGAAPDGGFFHKFPFTSSVKMGDGNALEFVGGFAKKTALGTEAEPYSLSSSGETREAPVVFAGFGVKAPASEGQPAYDSYADLDARGKWVLILRDLPNDLPPERRQYLNLYARLQHKVTVAREAGAIGVVVLDGLEPLKPVPGRALRFEGSLSSTSLPVWRVGGAWIKEILKKAGQDWDRVSKELNGGRLVSFVVPSTYLKTKTELVQEKSEGINVLARLKGRAPKAGAVLIGAHGDHLGHGEAGSSLAKGTEQGHVHFGADDNASGVAGVLELAHAFSARKRPLHDVVFAIWSAEEIGVLGSKAFVEDLAKKGRPFKDEYVAALNMDMIGRLRDRLQMQGAGSGDEWGAFAERAAVKTGVPLTATDDPYLPTDSISFYLAHVPSITFFTGAHAEYHSPRDTAETLNYPGIASTLAVVQDVAFAVADRPGRAVHYRAVKGNSGSRMEGRSFRIYLGTIPDYTQEGVKGVRISGVSQESPAQKAGLREKDVIVEFAGTRIENIYDYVYALQSAKPDVETGIRIRRGDRDVELKIVPKLKE